MQVPAGHVHWPPVQTWFLPQALPHEPQLVTVLTATQALPHACCADGHWQTLLTHVWPVAVHSALEAQPAVHTMFRQTNPDRHAACDRQPSRQA